MYALSKVLPDRLVKAFTIAVDEDEPDEPAEFPLASAEGFYQTVRQYL